MNPFNGLRNDYGVIYADPPWQFKLRSEVNLTKSPQGQYPCMSLEDIKALPVHTLTAPDCVLVLWATAPMLPHALEVVQGWGFTFKTAGAWAKRAAAGSEKWAFGTGYIYRSVCEFWLLGTKGKPVSNSRSIRNLIDAPRREHSRKPDQMRVMIQQQFRGPYVELFAREIVEGWDAWGNELGPSDPLGGVGGDPAPRGPRPHPGGATAEIPNPPSNED